MSKLALATALLILLACGSGETTQPAATTSGDVPPVSAPSQGDADAVGAAVDEAIVETAIEDASETAAVDAAASPSGCLELVNAADFAGALPVCAEALALDPENVEIQAALAEAQAQTALENATGAATEQAEGAMDDAQGIADGLDSGN